MLALSGFLIALLSYTLFALGVSGFFYKPVILAVVFFWLLIVLYIFYIKFKQQPNNATLKLILHNPFFYLLLAQIIINLVGVLGPELAFDSLWYHLSIPKIYLQLHRAVFIPGNLLYYSAMPKFVEMLFIAGLSLGSETFAKLVHFGFGILSLFVIYKIARRKFSPTTSIIACVIFYSNLLVGWESITAFVDLGRVFFELLALLSVLNFYKTKKIRWVIISGFMIGFAVATKLLAGVSVLILLICINAVAIRCFKGIKKIICVNVLYVVPVVIALFPWLLFAYANTGNPFFPIFSSLLRSLSFTFNIINFWNLFVTSSDTISPIYLITLPLIPFLVKKLNFESKIILFYSIGGIILSSIIPYSDFARYTLPYLAALSVFQLYIFDLFHGKLIAKIVLFLIIIFSFFSIFYRAVANAKYIPVVFGIESKNDFLTHNLNFSFGDFYDLNGDIKNKVGDSKVLIYGVHNLFYVDFNYIHESWVKRGDKIKYILVQDGTIPERFSNSNMVYQNTSTHVKLYSNKGGEWIY